MQRILLQLVALCLLWSTDIIADQESYDACERQFDKKGFLYEAVCYYKDGEPVDFKDIQKIDVKEHYKYYDFRIERYWNSRTGELSYEVNRKPRQWYVWEETQEEESEVWDILPDYFTVLKLAILVAIFFAIKKLYRMSTKWQQQDRPGRRYLVVVLIYIPASLLAFWICFLGAYFSSDRRGIDDGLITTVLLSSITMLVASFGAYKFSANTSYKDAEPAKSPKYRNYLLAAAIIQALIVLLFLSG